MRMILRLFLQVSILSFSLTVSGQCYFYKLFDYTGLSDFGNCVTQVASGGFLLGFRPSLASSSDATWLISINECGDTNWTRLYVLSPPPGGERTGSIIENEDGTYSLFGYHYDHTEGARSSYLFRVSETGDSLHHQIVNVGYNDGGVAAFKSKDGGYIGAGFFYSNHPDHLAFLVKTDSIGNILWQHSYGIPHYVYVKNLDYTHDGGYLLSGRSSNVSTNSYDFLLIKTDSAGNQEWMKLLGDSAWYGQGHGIATQDGGYIIAGYKDFDMSTEDSVRGAIIKTDANGNIIWEKLYGIRSVFHTFKVVQQLENKCLVLAGGRRNPQGGYDLWLMKTDADGNVLWERTYTYYGGRTHNYVEDLKVTSSGDFIMTGYIIPVGTGLQTGNDAYVLKTDSCGYTVGDTTLAGFTITNINGPAVSLSNQSQTWCSTLWYFGDGDSTWQHNPSHTYPDTGTFTITLITGAGNTVDIFQQQVTITSLVGVGPQPTKDQKQVKIYPNPAHQTLTIEMEAQNVHLRQVQLYDLRGSVLQSHAPAAAGKPTQRTTLNIQTLPPGIYFYRIDLSNGEQVRGKFVKE